jgi:hypothetical protein
MPLWEFVHGSMGNHHILARFCCFDDIGGIIFVGGHKLFQENGKGFY